MRKCFWTSCVGICGVILLIAGILVAVLFQDLVDSYIHGELPLEEGTSTFESWVSPPVNPQLKVYFFNLTNPEDFVVGGKPELEEVGPYVYIETWEKVNIHHHKDGTVSYQQKKIFVFSEEHSVGGQNDTIVTINVPMVSAVAGLEYQPEFMAKGFVAILKVLNEQLIIHRTVYELMWGYESKLIELGKETMPPDRIPPFDKFGFFVGRNNTPDPVLTAKTGGSNVYQIGEITSVNGSDHLKFWSTPECNMINGTDGSTYRPDIKPNMTLYLFNPQLCRSLPLVAEKEVLHHGIQTFRFTPPLNVFADTPENQCYCPCMGSGIFNVSRCQFGSPTMLSWPHFYQADPKYLQLVDGLQPDKNKHQFYMDIQPKMGVSMQARARMQINMLVEPTTAVPQFTAIKSLLYPILWFEDGIEDLNDEVVALLRQATETPEVAQAAMSITLFIIGGLMVLVPVIYFLKKRYSKDDGLSTVETKPVANGIPNSSFSSNKTDHSDEKDTHSYSESDTLPK